MAAFQYLPESFPSLLFDSRRREGGLYPHMVDVLSNMGKSALCNTNFNSDFFRRARVDNWSKNYGYHDSSNLEFTANVFGEVVGEQYGTLLGPDGNHYPGRPDEEPRPVTDRSSVKPVIVLAKPSLCDEVLGDYFHDQIVVFNDIRRADQIQEEEDNEQFDVKEIIRFKQGSSEPCFIALHGPLLYTVERDTSSNGKAPPRIMAKRRANGAPVRQPQVEPAVAQASQDEDIRHGRPLEEHELPGPEAVRVGAKYSPWVLPGYGGPKFDQRIARVIQADWRDGPGHLIPPWNTWQMLRPGTVIMATVVINVFVMPPVIRGRLHRKTYQALIKSLRILGRSDVPVEKPVADFNGQEYFVVSQHNNRDDPASSALRNLSYVDAVEDDGQLTDSSLTASSGGGRDNVLADTADMDHDIPEAGSSNTVETVTDNQQTANQEYLEDTEEQFVSNTRDRKGKRARRN
ncbi:hypothetical protein V5O48_001868 [Marasmius crinis-equi]|uniref:Uncharacterized protein n=1 Tax=Marasmius crinis-equi TaxID=585013 RepID=A0ABR3FXD1_9AGAR